MRQSLSTLESGPLSPLRCRIERTRQRRTVAPSRKHDRASCGRYSPRQLDSASTKNRLVGGEIALPEGLAVLFTPNSLVSDSG